MRRRVRPTRSAPPLLLLWTRAAHSARHVAAAAAIAAVARRPTRAAQVTKRSAKHITISAVARAKRKIKFYKDCIVFALFFFKKLKII